MPRKVKKEETKSEEVVGFYKGYNMRWLKGELSHPDYQLVKEYEKENGEIK